MDVMKEFQIRIKDGSKATQEGMAQMSASTQQLWNDFLQGKGTVADVANAIIPELQAMDDQVLAGQIGVSLFGTKWEDLESSAMYAMLGTTDAMTGFEGAMQGMVETQEQTFGQRFQALLREATTALQPLGNILLDLATTVMPYISQAVQFLSDKFSGLSPTTQLAVTAIGILAAALGPLLIVVGTLITSVGTVAGVLAGISAPVIAAVAVIATLGVAIAAAYMEFEGFRDKVNEVFNTVKELITAALSHVVSFVQEQLSKIQQFWSENGQQIMQAVQNLADFLVSIFEFCMPAIQFVVEYVWEAIKNVISGAIDIILGVVKAFSSLLTGDWEGLWEGIKQIVSGAIDLIVGWLSLTFVGGIKTLFTNLAKAGLNLLKGMWDEIAKVFTSMGSKASSLVDDMVQKVVSYFSGLLTKAKNIYGTLKTFGASTWEAIKQAAITIVTSMVNSVKTLFTNKLTAIKNTMSQVKTAISDLWDKAVAYLKNINLEQIGKDIINGLIKGIKSMVASTIEAITGVVDGVVNTAKKLLDIHSPSRVMKAIGEFTTEGLAVGIESKKDIVKEAMTTVGKLMKEIATENVSAVKGIEKKQSDELAKIEKDKVYKIEQIISKAQASKKKLTAAQNAQIDKIEADAAAKSVSTQAKYAEQLLKLQQDLDKNKLDSVKQFIADKKGLEQLNVIEEAQIWAEAANQFAEGSNAHIQAQIAYRDALKSVQDTITNINDAYANKVIEVNSKLQDAELKLTDAYTKAVDDRAKSLVSFASLFEAFDSTINTTGKELLSNLESQVSGFEEWQKEIESLSTKAIDEGLLEELRQMGPKALGELKGLNSLSETELTKYSELYKQKMELAREQSVSELQGLKTDTEKKIQELREAANVELTQLEKEWVTQLKSLTSTSKNELSSLNQVGKDAVSGLMNGMFAMKGTLESKVREIAQTIIDTTKDVLDIHSPSRVMRDEVGLMIGEGLAIGIERSSDKVEKASVSLANTVKDTLKEVPSIIEQYGEAHFSSFDNVMKKYKDILWMTGDMYGVEALKFLKATLEMDRWTSYERGEMLKEYEEQLYLSQFRLVDMQKTYNDRVVQIEANRVQKQSELLAQYEAEVTKRTEEIYKQFGLLDSVELKSLTGDDLIGSLDSQITAMETYTESVEKLASRGVSGKLLEEISALGPSMAGQVASFANLTDEELNRYIELWNKKNQIARQTAESELTSMREKMQEQLQLINQEAATELEKYKQNYEYLYNEIHGITSNEMNELRGNLVQDGANAMQGLINGMESQRASIIATAQSIADAVSQTIQSALDIHSPSRVLKKLGIHAGEGLAIGIDESIGMVIASAKNLASAAIPPVSTNSITNSSNVAYDYSRSMPTTIQVNASNDTIARQIAAEQRKLQFGFLG